MNKYKANLLTTLHDEFYAENTINNPFQISNRKKNSAAIVALDVFVLSLSLSFIIIKHKLFLIYVRVFFLEFHFLYAAYISIV